MKKKKKEIKDSKPHVSDLDQAVFKASSITTKNLDFEDYKTSGTLVPLATDQLKVVTDSMKNSISNIFPTFHSKISFFNKDSLEINMLNNVHSTVRSLQDSLVVDQRDLFSSVTDNLKDSFVIDNSRYMPQIKPNSAFNWVLGRYPTRYEPPIEGQLVTTVSDVLNY